MTRAFVLPLTLLNLIGCANRVTLQRGEDGEMWAETAEITARARCPKGCDDELREAIGHPEEPERALATLGSFELQKLMHVGRGTLAVRTDVAGEERDPVLREKYRLLAEGNLAIAMSGLVPSSFSEELAAAVAEMLQQHDIEPVVQMLRSRYPLLRR